MIVTGITWEFFVLFVTFVWWQPAVTFNELVRAYKDRMNNRSSMKCFEAVPVWVFAVIVSAFRIFEGIGIYYFFVSYLDSKPNALLVIFTLSAVVLEKLAYVFYVAFPLTIVSAITSFLACGASIVSSVLIFTAHDGEFEAVSQAAFITYTVSLALLALFIGSGNAAKTNSKKSGFMSEAAPQTRFATGIQSASVFKKN